MGRIKGLKPAAVIQDSLTRSTFTQLIGWLATWQYLAEGHSSNENGWFWHGVIYQFNIWLASRTHSILELQYDVSYPNSTHPNTLVNCMNTSILVTWSSSGYCPEHPPVPTCLDKWRPTAIPIRCPDLIKTTDQKPHQQVYWSDWRCVLWCSSQWWEYFKGIDGREQTTTLFLSNKHFQSESHLLIEEAVTGRNSAWLRSFQGKGVGEWPNAVPTSNSSVLNYGKFHLASSLRLGLTIFPDWVQQCNCDTSLNDSGYHLLTCTPGGGPVGRTSPLLVLFTRPAYTQQM